MNSSRVARHKLDDYKPSEFELMASRLAKAGLPESLPGFPGAEERIPAVRRFGFSLLWKGVSGESITDDVDVPEDYVLGPGDEVLLDLWGSVEASLRLRVSRGGSIAVPRVGTIQVAGMRFSELPDQIRQRVARTFKQFGLAVSMGELRTIRVTVTGQVARPGEHRVSSLASLTQVLASAGGPTAVGSMRQILLRRGGKEAGKFDLYDWLLKGQVCTDCRIRSGDVVHVPAVGAQVAVIGSVNHAAVFELKGEEAVEDLLEMAGGLSAVADRSSATVLSLGMAQPVRALDLERDRRKVLRSGEVLRVSSLADLSRPGFSQLKRVRVEGEVKRPGDYVLPAGATLNDAMAAAGGPSGEAFIYGAELRRETARKRQIENLDKVLRELETELTRAAVNRKELAMTATTQDESLRVSHLRLIERLRQAQPTGRVVLQTDPEATGLPAMPLEDGDRLIVPSRVQPVNVYGSVFGGGSYQYTDKQTLGHFLRMAGGATRGADSGSMFVLRADGSIVGKRKGGSWWSSRPAFEQIAALPGDTIFVPEEMDKVRLTQELKDWAQILSQFGLGAVALKNLTQ
ncbi:protein involved in polysaccharide export with SLBB domain [Inhella inkyongensis]|uniref:Protein involved in polysaccharide export with SLBB domain n=1 Tax=Inhella inkyongensis TaxID=392593 RepID=A0A840S637_9BURK|nr:SLBB domain-containing protein [Inhella inkyongensis]MBB5204466.1 protein involved in polysaccharide export with SLBB domain [Inhella inkyongensis]